MTSPVQITMDETDFHYLIQNAMRWADSAEGWTGQIREGRFEAHGHAGRNPSLNWTMAYWVGTEYVSVILARSFLAAQGFDSEAVVDTGTNRADWMILTDYDNWSVGK